MSGNIDIIEREGIGKAFICHVYVVTSQRMLDTVYLCMGFYHALCALQVHNKAFLFKLST